MAADRITLRNMQFYGHHGVYAAERELGGEFAVDVELRRDLRRAGETDRIRHTVDYKKVYDLVDRVQTATSYRLLEALAEDVATSILTAFDVDEVTVRARKSQTPVGGVMDYVEVEITRGRGDRAD